MSTRAGLPTAIGWLMLLAALWSAACMPLHRRIIEAPRPGQRALALNQEQLDKLGVETRYLRSADGLILAHAVLEPRDHGLNYRVFKHEGRSTWMHRYRVGDPGPVREEVRGTVILVHGWSMDSTMMLPWAVALAEHGWRSVLLELRGHGRSQRAPTSYGPDEARDVLALVDYLRDRGELAGPLALFGVSLGASTVLHAASDVGPELAAVIAMEPYGNAADGIASTIAGLVEHGTGSRWRERMLRRLAGWRYDQDDIQAAIDRAAGVSGMDLRGVDVHAVMAAAPVCVLHVHGAVDTLIPVEQARRLAAANPAARYVELPDDGHFSTPGRVDWLAAPVDAWLRAAATMTGAVAACPPFELPDDPAVMLTGDAEQDRATIQALGFD